MALTLADRVAGISTSVAVKAPVQAITTANITLATLSPGSLVFGAYITSLVEGTRVLVMAQADSTQNGIYVASTGDWNRDLDFDGDRDVVNGTLIPFAVSPGYGALYQLSCADNPVSIGSSQLAFSLQQAPAGTYPRTQAEINASVTPTNYAYAPGVVDRYGTNTTPGTTNMATAIANAIASWNGARGKVTFLAANYAVGSALTCSANGIEFVGSGFSENNGTGSANRGATSIVRAFVGSSPTLTVSGNDCGIDGIDVDNNLQGTGECVVIWGSRFRGGAFSTRNSGGDGFRIGKTDAGVSTINANAWQVEKIITCGNAAAGFRIDDTNTSTSTSYPLGAPNANAGYCALVDARSNGTDGLQLGNCQDNVFSMVASQSNTGCGIRFKTDGTNSGPRCNKILGNDAEGNTGNDIQIDAATLPAAAPGLYNVIFGNRSVAVVSRIVDNSTGSLVIQWNSGLSQRAYHFGSDVNAANSGGNAGFNMYVGANLSPARWYAVASGAADSIMRAQVHVAGVGNTDCLELNQNGVFRPYRDLGSLPYSASMTIDASAGNVFEATCTNGTAFTFNAPTNPQQGQRITVVVRNTSGGALGAATWNAVFKLATWTNPANANSRSITFLYDGTNWVEISRTPADVPN